MVQAILFLLVLVEKCLEEKSSGLLSRNLSAIPLRNPFYLTKNGIFGIISLLIFELFPIISISSFIIHTKKYKNIG
jgi:hypothetical protein